MLSKAKLKTRTAETAALIGSWIKQWRTVEGLSMTAMAKLLDSEHCQTFRLEHGLTDPKLSTLIKIAVATNSELEIRFTPKQ